MSRPGRNRRGEWTFCVIPQGESLDSYYMVYFVKSTCTCLLVTSRISKAHQSMCPSKLRLFRCEGAWLAQLLCPYSCMWWKADTVPSSSDTWWTTGDLSHSNYSGLVSYPGCVGTFLSSHLYTGLPLSGIKIYSLTEPDSHTKGESGSVRLKNISLIPRLPRSGTQILQLCRRGEPGIFSHVRSTKGREGVKRPYLSMGVPKDSEQEKERR